MLANPPVVVHHAPAPAHHQLSHREQVAYGRAYAHVKDKFGIQVAGCKLIGKDATCRDRTPSAAAVRKSTATLHRFFAPPPPPPAPAPAPTTYSTSSTSPSYTSSYSGGGYSDVPGVPSSFAACVAARESSDGAGSSNVYGIIVDPRGNGSIEEQKQAFSELYAQDGTSPWAPYDGC